MSSVVISGDTSGAITLQAPAVSGNTTLNLPASSGTLLTTASTTGANGSAISTGIVAEAYGGTGTSTGYYGFKNRIINGAMSINQRVNSLSTNNSQGYFIDRMWGFSGLSTAATFSQQSSSGLTGFPFFARAQRNSGNTGIAGVYMGQIVESNNLQDLQGQQVTLSFWARAGANYSASGNTLAVYIRTGTTADQGLNQLIAGWAGQSDLASTVTLTTSWQYFSRTFTLASNIQELSIFFWNAVSGTAGASDFFDVTGVQLEKGSTATSFDYRPYGTELALCQRYYVKTYDIATVAGTATFNGSLTARVGATDNFAYAGYFTFPVSMRASPSITIYAPGTGAINNITNNVAGNRAATITQPAGTAGVNIQANNVSTSTGTSNYAHVVAEAEL